ncbi:phosphotransferase system, enzyme I, PtsP [Cohaesibacter sp. ES.047]|uniref:phosphoenolpyruvate--protein phosphotransferase n=1 Tax=Cohaesibacter sp. ES.047 TaxID=1798205 RepID=UPI000BB98AAE|nr:phosphoenolpyruvate--protein phosphotransferase [Cohaesibacter sp. ES.047]SNY92408.1 phosphotransferase system, enzyme I, PtsP [Cohaesibacter sp. ES.047]
MRGNLGGPRILLRRLRETMAKPTDAQERLNEIVRLIAANMVAEVCSVYVLRADNLLELYATEGLNPNAVHQTQLNVGEGLVGHIALEARILNLSEPQEHPAFAYRPETGEEIYHAFLGVPILRAGRVLGVLVVQNKSQRIYSDEEVEALQTTAMVLAELIASGELKGLSGPGGDLDLVRPMRINGLSMAEGLGLGRVVLHEPRIVVTNLIAEDLPGEEQRLETAIEQLRLSVDDLLSRDDISHGGEHREILEAYRMFAYDRGWVRRMVEAIHSGLTAEAAVERVQSDTRARMLRSTDPYLRDRLHDFDDLANRLLRQLVGNRQGSGDGQEDTVPSDAIIVARNMGAAELLDYGRDHVRGLVLEEGAPTSHVVIVARALGIPTVGQAEAVVSLCEDGDSIIVDGDMGQVHLRPPSDVEASYVDQVKFRAKRQEQYRKLRDKPAVTKDGVDVDLMMNAGLLVDLPNLADAGAKGIGLFRTELQFMVAENFPRMREQENVYRKVLDSTNGMPVTFRSLDVGGDKVLAFLRMAAEENPAMGWRAVRLGLDRPGLLRTQIRALLHAAAGRSLKLMFPMITNVGEYDAAIDLFNREMTHLERHGYEKPSSILLGAMLEVPSLLFELDELMDRVDFLSIGTNDLHQFMMASDRGNARLSGRYSSLSPPFLRALRHVIRKGDKKGVPVTICGELAGKPFGAMAMLALGYRRLSMVPSAIGPVKAMVLDLPLGELSAVFGDILDTAVNDKEIKDFLADFAEKHNIQVPAGNV